MAKDKDFNFDLELDRQVWARVKAGLESAIDDAVKTKDLQAVATRIQSIILLRTSQGEYLTGSGGKKRRRYRSESHKQKRAALGLPTDRVTLFFGELGLLEALRARGRQVLGKPTIEVGYLAGLSESKATEIAGYMNEQGVGRNRIKYRYVGLTEREKDTVINFLRGRIAANLN